MATSSPSCRLGVLAFGDSITNGGGELQWGVALQSWALWVARALGLPFTSYATDGALVGDVLREQLPAFELRRVAPASRYDVGCVYIGVNDVRAAEWDAGGFEREFAEVLGFVGAHCDRVLTVTAPFDLGRPRAGANVRELDSLIERAAAQAGALVLDLSSFGARNLVMADHVHPTAFGQIAIAEHALDVLSRDGMPVVVRPSALVRYETTAFGRLRGDLTYAYRHLKVSARSAAVTAGRRRSR